ncbi:uncharacterized protein RCO7_09988 [Rhynchosporium graminicola]|uniref:PhoD-like phosphatase domain-containing protein n=1 Tax=Rhynchosporium graminicola TaxID=2792576 RepID=A0A1E1L1S5_9HELO|nr:uncharacterized protein RCO7_09988 [Rhynchosporium commune]
MSAPYWGQLPPPKISRRQREREEEEEQEQEQVQRGSNPLSINTNMAGDRLSNNYPSRSNPRPNRFSTQTDAPTVSTQSPFASPIASEFRGDGLAPGPSAFQPGALDTTHNRDYLEKRRRRQSRDQYEEPVTGPPPAAPEVPRAPPISYKQPYGNGAPVPVRPGYSEQAEQLRRESSNGKAPIRHSGSQKQQRKSSLSEAEEQRHREWAPDRSPLQRLELTLDSITKEEKRARVEEAESVVRGSQSGRGGEPVGQNSVRFRNRPVAKATSEAISQPQSISEYGSVRNSSNKQKDQLQQKGTVEKARSVQRGTSADFDHQPQPQQDVIDVPRKMESVPQRNTSVRDRSHIPVSVPADAAVGATVGGVNRSESKKLRKNPPDDPWYTLRTDQEKANQKFRETRDADAFRKQSVGGEPARDTAFRSHPQDFRDKELPGLPRNAQQYPVLDHEIDRLDLEPEAGKPVRRLSKVERLTGSSDPRIVGNARTERVLVNGVQYDVPPKATADLARHKPAESHYFSKLIHHRHEDESGPGIYVASKRLDEWKKGGVALLSGSLLDLDVSNQTEEEKDKAWWEAGNTGARRRNSVKQRKAEAYDGEYDSSNATVSYHAVRLRDRQFVRYDKKTGDKVPREPKDDNDPPSKGNSALNAPNPQCAPNPQSEPPKSRIPITKTHSLTCEMRFIRVCPDTAPTRFKPNLFLKSGPMLRYCSTRREKVRSRSKRNQVLPDREIWRGSIMIVTQDAHSNYDLAPTLRLFLQPVDLLPPPPAQVDGEMDELAPEYVDPIAGLPKIGRDGRTLYVRPIDHLEEEKDLSREESDDGLFEMHRSPLDGSAERNPASKNPHYDGEKAGKYKEVRGFRLHAEQNVTFWRFNIEVELRSKQQRIAYRLNRGPATAFWVPARGEAMNIMFSSCNGFSHDVDPNAFCGPDPLWRDVLNTHQTQPFHVMLGGGDQIYNDRVMYETLLFKEWLDIKDPHHKEKLPFTPEMQQELEAFYLNRYSMWFSQGLFGLAVSQIPMVNIFDDHDIIDGFGSYPDSYMRSPIFSGLGSVAFKYYMLFQHQSSIDEGEDTEPSWILGTQPGPYITELSRSVFTTLGREIAFLGLDCRTERMYDEVVSAETYDKVFERLEKEIIRGETKHLVVLLGIPVAYPRMVWLENILTSRVMEPLKAMSRAGILGKKLLNKMDGGVEILDDLDDHWTAKHHKKERNWFIQELQDLAAMKSVRVTILGGDVHLGAIGQFYSNPKMGIPKDRDFRYMPNIVSSAIVNSPPPDALADLLNKRNKVHHLDSETDEDMIPIFTHDVNGKPRNNKRLLNRRNWCSIRLYDPELTPPATPEADAPASPPPRGGLLRRLSSSRGPSYRPDSSAPVTNKGKFGKREAAPPLSSPGFFARRNSTSQRASIDSERPGVLTRTLSLSRKDFVPGLFRRNSKKRPDDGGINGYGADSDDDVSYDEQPQTGLRGGSGGHDSDEGYFPVMPVTGRTAQNPLDEAPTTIAGAKPQQGLPRNQFHRTPTGLSVKELKKPRNQAINLEGGLDICLNMEVNPKDPAGITTPYRLLVPALFHEEPPAKAGVSRSRSRSRSGSSMSSSVSSDTGGVVQPRPGKLKRWNTLTKAVGIGKDSGSGRNLADARFSGGR